MFGSASSPGQLRHSESNQSINRKMWDSSDPTRNPAPLPLPDHHAPISGIRTQTKISAAHKRLATTTSSRSLSQLASENDETSMSLYDLVSTIHTNLELLIKRSQNNARDLGKLRGDVKNPQAIEDIKKLLQESSVAYANGDQHDSEKRRELESELAHKVDALLKASLSNNAEKVPSSPVISTPDPAIMAQFSAAVTSAASAAVSSSQVSEQLEEMQIFLKQHLPVHIPDPLPVLPVAEMQEQKPMVATIDTSQLEETVNMLNRQILSKVEELQKLDTALLSRRSDLANLENRTTILQHSITNLVSQMDRARAAEELQRRTNQEIREKKENALRPKKSKRALVPLAPTHDRRIVSLSNVSTTPNRKHLATNSSGLAAPLKSESPFSQRSVLLVNSPTNPAETEVKKIQHRSMQMTLRSPPPRKTSWSRRVSQIFLSNNKENSLLNSVYEDGRVPVEAKESSGDGHEQWSSLGRGTEGGQDVKGSMKSFRSFSHR